MKKLLFLFLVAAFETVSISGCAGTHTGDLPPDATLDSAPGIYAVSYNPDGSIKTEWWFDYHRARYNKLISEFPQYGLKSDDNILPDGIYWRADFAARKQFEELDKIEAMDNFGMSLPKHL